MVLSTREARASELVVEYKLINFELNYIVEPLHSQLDSYKKRKKLLFKRMKIGTIGMCLIVIFLVWLQEWLPNKNRQFWNKGMGLAKCIFSFRLSIETS